MAASKPHKPLIITEGPVKALAIAQAGHLPIGIGGVWMAMRKGANEQAELIPALSEFNWFGRSVYLAFDADSATNPAVRQALFRTWLALYRLGAKVRFLSWPPSEGKGIDDYLCAKQVEREEPAKALGRMLNAAQEISAMLVSEDLLMVIKELVIANLSRAQLTQTSRLLTDTLKTRASDIEKDVLGGCTTTDGKAFDLPDPEPWPHRFEADEMLREIMELLQKHVVMSEDQAVATALWILLTYLEAQVDTLPILAVTSPQKQCGKTTLLSILRRLVRKPLPASNVSAAALYRSVEKWTPTLLVDEADSFLKENNELRGVLNAGHKRDMAYVLRANGETLEPERFSAWAPKAIACIGKLPDTLTDRSIEIRLQRRTKAEMITPLRDAAPETFDRLARQLCRWALDNGEKVRINRPQVPSILQDRAADNWLPLLAIASVFGGNWPDLALSAALDLRSGRDSEETVPIVLLVELQQIVKADADFFPTDEILEALNKNKEAPWADWKHQMTAEKLAKILLPFGVKPRQKRHRGDPVRGYNKQDLKPVFERYLNPSSPSPPEKVFQPVTLPVEQLSDLVGSVTTSKVQPVTSSVGNCDPLRAQSALGLDSPEGVTSLQAKTEIAHSTGIPNGAQLDLDKAKKIKFAASTVDGEILGSDQLGRDIPGTILSPENGYGTKLPHALKPEQPKPSLTLAKDRSRTTHPALEKHLLTILAPHDREGGLSYDELLRRVGLSDEEFDKVLKSLCRRGLVYKSVLNGRYQLSPRFAEILARQKPGKP
ncbi:MAG: DUF3631 domain-containing protein [Verrucomicrobia bacterium]|nr:DUF3631 domain-containing protein [Verrucomicrobiota bacterium]